MSDNEIIDRMAAAAYAEVQEQAARTAAARDRPTSFRFKWEDADEGIREDFRNIVRATQRAAQ